MKILRPISILALIALVLTSSTNFTVGMHFCKGEIQDIAFFTKAEACEEEQRLPPCHRHTPAPCCDDETVIHEGEDLKAAPSTVHVTDAPFIDADFPLILISEIIPSLSASHRDFILYDPPLPVIELTVKHQVFRI